MTVPTESQTPAENKSTNSEINFQKQRLMYERQLKEKEEKIAQLQNQMKVPVPVHQEEDEEEDNEPYVDKKRLDKKLQSFEKKMSETIERESQKKANDMIRKYKQENWLKSNPDFYQVMEQYTDQWAEEDPDTAETILQMPPGFEREKLVYKSIKASSIGKPVAKEPTTQEKIDANRRSPYYQPTNQNAAPYANVGNFSPQGQKEAYAKMQELKSRLRL